jgi:hypothetical protein
MLALQASQKRSIGGYTRPILDLSDLGPPLLAFLSFPARGIGAFRRSLDMRGIQRQAGKRQAADQIAQNRRDLVPDKVIHDRKIPPHDQAGREQKHIDHRVLEGHAKEQHDRHPHGDHLAAYGCGNHRPDHSR